MYGPIKTVLEISNIAIGIVIAAGSNQGVAVLNGFLAYREYCQNQKIDPKLFKLAGATYSAFSSALSSVISGHKETYRQFRTELSTIITDRKYTENFE